MPYLLDTNHLSPLVTPKHPLRQRVMQALQNGGSFALCLPCVTETIYGIGILPRAKKNMAEWAKLISRFNIHIPQVSDAEQAAELQIALRRQGWQLDTIDAFIAVVALRKKLILLTTDKDFAAVPNLTVENWLS